MYLVVGATGPVGLGGEICRLLRAAGRPTRALVRPTSDAQRVEGLRQAGVDLVQGDLKDRRSLQAACRDVRTVISTASMMVSRQPDDTVERVDGRGHADFIDVAKGCGVESFVYTSFSGRIDRSFPFRDAKRDVEGHLKTSGLTYTILRPTFYMEVWLTPIGGFDYLNGRATIYGEGRNKISWLSFYDVARFALMLTTIGQALSGHSDRAREAIGTLEEYTRAGTIGNDDLAMVYAAVGESRRARELLERACEERGAALPYAAVEPMMEFLRVDPECRPVLERAGLIAPVVSR